MTNPRLVNHFVSAVAGMAVLFALGLSACGPSAVMLHSRTGDPIAIQESAYTAWGCRRNLSEEAERVGMALKSTDVKGWFFGDSLMWPFVKGYVCLGTDQDLPPGILGKTYVYQG